MMEKQWTVYILECGDGTLYTGITDDLQRRLKAHAEGRGAKYTRGRGPLKLRYLEIAGDKSAALKRECALKRLPKCKKLEIIRENQENRKSLLAIEGNPKYTECNNMRTYCPHGEVEKE